MEQDQADGKSKTAASDRGWDWDEDARNAQDNETALLRHRKSMEAADDMINNSFGCPLRATAINKKPWHDKLKDLWNVKLDSTTKS